MTAATECAECGAVIDTGEWHPATTAVDDGDLRILAFCGQECRQQWRAARTNQPRTPDQ